MPRKSRNASKWAALLLFMLSLAVCRGFAQGNTNEEQGTKPFDSTSGGDLDSISLTDGGLTLRVPLVSFPQRGNLNLGFFITNSTKQWFVKTTTSCGFNPRCTPTWVKFSWTPVKGQIGARVTSNVDWRLLLNSSPDVNDSFTSNLFAVGPDGTAHLLAGANGLSVSYPARSLDATGLLLAADKKTLIMPDGTNMYFGGGKDSSGTQPFTITDANGNQIAINTAGSNIGWMDTLGRWMPGSGPTGGVITPGVATTDLSTCPSGTVSANIFNVPGINGVLRAFKFCYSNVTLQTSFNAPGVTSPTEYGPVSQALLTAVVLPDLTMWTLTYDGYGSVTRLGLPKGGSISYTYVTRGQPCNNCSQTTTSRWVASRTMDANDGTGGHTWTYNYTTTGVTVTDPQGNDTVHTITSPVANAVGLYETQIQLYQGSAVGGTLLKTVATQYSGAASSFTNADGVPLAINVVPAQITVTLPGGQTSKLVNTFDSGAFAEPDGNPVVAGCLLQQDQYDFSGTLARSILNHYLWQDNATYKNANFLSLASSRTVKDGTGTQVAQSAFAYDQAAVVSSGVTTSFVVPPAGATVRGNMTTGSQWLNSTNGLISTLGVYFDTGMPASVTDPNGNTSSFQYSTDYAGAYQTKTTHPVTSSINHIWSGTYDYYTGLLTSFTDENGQVSSFTYFNDRLRLHQINHPDTGQTTFTYANATTVERQRKIDSTRSDDLIVNFDGLGRVIKTQTATPSGTVFSNTTYDTVGRVAAVSNPFYSTTDSTYGLTQTQYDALGRVQQVTKADGSIATTQYTNNCVTATDEAGHSRKACSDAFGRLVEVDEPGNSFAGTASGGTLTLTGTLRSQGGATATPGKGSVTVSGSEQTKPGTPFTSGSASITITGGEVTMTVDPCYNPDVPPPSPSCPRDISDTGSVSITVNGFTASTSYGAGSTTASVASALASALNVSSSPVTASVNGSILTITSKATGTGSNYSFSTTSSTNDVADFGGPSFVPSPATGTMSGGGGSAAVYDSGTCTVTVNGTAYSTTFGQGDTSTTVASRLAAAISGGTLASATASGGTISMTAKLSGAATNYRLASSCTFNSSVFTSASFSAGASGSTFSGGADAGPTVYDSGTVTVTIGSFTASAPYSQTGNSTAAQVATALVGSGSTGLNRAGSPVTASASGANISIIYNTVGAAGNLAVSASSASSNSTAFPGGSFTGSTNLTGGADPLPSSLSNPYVTLYSYDALGDLLSVNQKGDGSQAARVRSFAYDSLSRLLTATNPESGQVTYTYDNNSNMVTKKDARGLTITYQYDALNRLTHKLYSDGTTTTSYYYDAPLANFPNATNVVGRLVWQTNNVNTASAFSYDSMGRVVYKTNWTPSNPSGTANPISATYDLLGRLTSLTYPSTRQITYSYNTAGQIDQVQLAQMNGTAVGYNYATAADTNFYPFGAPKVFTLGNGLVEAYSFNQRLELSEETVGIPGGATFADHAYNYNPGADNGNVINAYDKLNSARTQSFTYDALNRLASATESRWGLSFVYDPWGNRLQQNVTAGSAFSSVLTVDANNHIQGAPTGCTSTTAYCYDTAGNLLNDSIHQYKYDIEGRIATVDGGNASYTYDGVGKRVRKDVSGQPGLEYIYFGGSAIAEHDVSNGNWTDYVFAGGRRIAKATNFEHQLHIGGQICANCGWQWYQFNFTNLGALAGRTIQSGDSLRWMQWSNGGSKGGIIMTYTDGTDSCCSSAPVIADQHGEAIGGGNLSTNQWEYRIANLSPVAGKAVSQIRLYANGNSTPPQWDIYYQDLVYVAADGTVIPLFSQNATAPGLSGFGSTGMTQTVANLHDCTSGCAPINTTTYYHSDQVSSSRLLTNGNGYPVWQGTFLPFGEEYNPQITTNHYKFSDKERDAESNLDYFGARSYSSALGRFVSADWSATPAAVPYANLGNPQTLNLYAYTHNNPTSRRDLDGHFDDPFGVFSEGDTSFSNIGSAGGPGMAVVGYDDGQIDPSRVRNGEFFNPDLVYQSPTQTENDGGEIDDRIDGLDDGGGMVIAAASFASSKSNKESKGKEEKEKEPSKDTDSIPQIVLLGPMDLLALRAHNQLTPNGPCLTDEAYARAMGLGPQMSAPRPKHFGQHLEMDNTGTYWVWDSTGERVIPNLGEEHDHSHNPDEPQPRDLPESWKELDRMERNESSPPPLLQSNSFRSVGSPVSNAGVVEDEGL